MNFSDMPMIRATSLIKAVVIAVAATGGACACRSANPSAEDIRSLFVSQGVQEPQKIELVPGGRSPQLTYTAFQLPRQAKRDLCVSRRVWLTVRSKNGQPVASEIAGSTTLWLAGECKSAGFGEFHKAFGVSVEELPDGIDSCLNAAHNDPTLDSEKTFESDAIRAGAKNASLSELRQIHKEGNRILCEFFVKELLPNELLVELKYGGGRLSTARIRLGNGPDVVGTPNR